MVLSEPTFSQLRTKEQLGYVVAASTTTSCSTCWFKVTVQSHSASAQAVESRIDGFLSSFKEQLAHKTETEIEARFTGFLKLFTLRW